MRLKFTKAPHAPATSGTTNQFLNAIPIPNTEPEDNSPFFDRMTKPQHKHHQQTTANHQEDAWDK